MDDCFEALISLVRAHGDAVEFFEFPEEVFDQVAPFTHLFVDLEGPGSARMLRYDDLRAALIYAASADHLSKSMSITPMPPNFQPGREEHGSILSENL